MINEQRPWRIIITRPYAQAVSWAQQLAELGFSPVRLSLLEIEPFSSPEQVQGSPEQTRGSSKQLQAIKNQVMNLDLYSKIIFVSQNAVHYGMQWISDYWPQLPVKVDFFAVGATTAKALMDYGIRVQDLAASERGAMTSETLLQAPQLQQVSGEKILIMRGQGGRGHLADCLRARGAQVEYCELYQRRLPEAAWMEWQALLQDGGAWQQQPTIISVHSGESLEHLLAVIAQLEQAIPQKNSRLLLLDTPLLVPSARIAEVADKAGFTQCIIAANATDTAMTESLLHYYRAASAP